MDEVTDHVFQLSSRINSTWGGSLTDMVRCQRYLEIIEEDNLLQSCQKTGNHMKKQLNYLSDEFPKLISGCRGLGLMLAFDLPSADIRDRFLKQLFEQRLLALATGVKGIRFRPHLDFAINDANVAIEAVRTVAKTF